MEKGEKMERAQYYSACPLFGLSIENINFLLVNVFQVLGVDVCPEDGSNS